MPKGKYKNVKTEMLPKSTMAHKWFDEWAEGESMPGRYNPIDSSLPLLDGLEQAARDFIALRSTMRNPADKQSLAQNWDKFCLFIGLTGGKKPRVSGLGLNATRQSLGDKRQHDYQDLCEEQVTMTGLFLKDPENVVKIFFSNYASHRGNLSSKKFCDNAPILVDFFLKFLQRNRVFPDIDDQLCKAIAITQLAITELPHCIAMNKILPDDFGRGCEQLFSAMNSYNVWTGDTSSRNVDQEHDRAPKRQKTADISSSIAINQSTTSHWRGPDPVVLHRGTTVGPDALRIDDFRFVTPEVVKDTREELGPYAHVNNRAQVHANTVPWKDRPTPPRGYIPAGENTPTSRKVQNSAHANAQSPPSGSAVPLAWGSVPPTVWGSAVSSTWGGRPASASSQATPCANAQSPPSGSAVPLAWGSVPPTVWGSAVSSTWGGRPASASSQATPCANAQSPPSGSAVHSTWGSVPSTVWGSTRSSTWDASDGVASLQSSTEADWESGSVQHSTHNLLVPTTLAVTHTTGIVERSTRLIKSVIPPQQPVNKQTAGMGMVEYDLPVDAAAVEHHLDMRFAKLVMAPWPAYGKDEKSDVQKPRILYESCGAAVLDDCDSVEVATGPGQQHNPFKDDIVVYVAPEITGSMWVGMSIEGVWVQLARVDTEVSIEVSDEQSHSMLRNENAQSGPGVPIAPTEIWYLQHVRMVLPSFHTEMAHLPMTKNI